MEQGAFLPFYEQHKETLYHYACTLTANAHQAEDALQNAWLLCLWACGRNAACHTI